MSDRDHEPTLVPPQRVAPASEVRSRAGASEPLPAELAAEMGATFAADFREVRVRRDAAAAADARREGADAYTHGDEITFAEGRYDPSSSVGRALIAHELGHVVQQRRGGATAGAENRAARSGAAAAAGRRVDRATLGGAPVGIQRQPSESPPAPEAAERKETEEAAASTWRRTSYVLDRFAVDKDALTRKHLEQIDEIAFHVSLHAGMLRRGKATIEIVGHADTTGKDPHNDELGAKRADRVREALERKLGAREGEKPLTVEWAVRSAGERELLVPTADQTLEPRNRAVEVRVSIESLPEPAAKPPAAGGLAPGKVAVPEEEEPRGPRRPPEQEDWWKRAEENQRRIEEYDRKHPRKRESLQDIIVGGVTKAVDPLIRKLPISSSKKRWLREKLRDAVEAGTEKGCEAAIDAAGATGEQAEALKAACKAAIQEKGGRK